MMGVARNRPARWVALAGACVLGALTLGAPASFAAEADGGCVECHTAAPATTQEATPTSIAWLETSVHRALTCTDCHSDATSKGELEGKAPHSTPLRKVACTERCHRKGNVVGAPDLSPMEEYKDSVHGRARLKGDTEAPSCADCHGKHNIRGPADPASSVSRRNLPITCSRCHSDMKLVVKHHIHAEKPFEEYERSVHGRAVLKDGLATQAAVCIDCHGVHAIAGPGQGPVLARDPATCGKCHAPILETYRGSIHGTAALEQGVAGAPLCVDCHGEHTIAAPDETKIAGVCSRCHESLEIAEKYNIPSNRASTYLKSYHGIASRLGGVKQVANCASCHGYHDILPSSDPRSSVHPANLAATCGKPDCHPGMPARVAGAKIHVDPEKDAGAAHWVYRALVWCVIVLAVVSVIWVVPDVVRRLQARARK